MPMSPAAVAEWLDDNAESEMANARLRQLAVIDIGLRAHAYIRHPVDIDDWWQRALPEYTYY